MLAIKEQVRSRVSVVTRTRGHGLFLIILCYEFIDSILELIIRN